VHVMFDGGCQASRYQYQSYGSLFCEVKGCS
jgi:hypothetical protein